MARPLFYWTDEKTDDETWPADGWKSERTEALRVYEAAILDVANVETIDLDVEALSGHRRDQRDRAGRAARSHARRDPDGGDDCGGSWECRMWW